jgi:SAM-dependent methyltransferase
MDDIVKAGYDRIAEAYAAQRDAFDSLPYLDRFIPLLPAGRVVLDAGCGTGVPAARFLVDRGFTVIGIDVSSRMVELAGASIPEATFEVRDLRSLRPGEYTVDGIVALYSLFHVPRAEHEGLLRTFRTFLPNAGAMLLTMGAEDWEGTEPDFHGVEMYWSHFGPERNRSMLETAGFEVTLDEIDTSGGERHQVLLARAV